MHWNGFIKIVLSDFCQIIAQKCDLDWQLESSQEVASFGAICFGGFWEAGGFAKSCWKKNVFPQERISQGMFMEQMYVNRTVLG